MTTEATTSTNTIDTAGARTGSNGSRRAPIIFAVAGGLALVVYAYAAFRWAPIDSIELLVLTFGLLLLAYAALAVVGVRAGVVAPFVVAALLLPWACGAAAAVGIGGRAQTLVDQFTQDFSGGLLEETQEATPLADESQEANPSPEAIPENAAAATTYTSLIEPYNQALEEVSSAEEVYYASNGATDWKRLQAADEQLSAAASQAATDLRNFASWPPGLATAAAALASSLEDMAQAAEAMSQANSSTERDRNYSDFTNAQDAGAPSAIEMREALGLPSAPS